ncbi:MAG TPA: hypothetical protein P5048_04385, partial [Chlamydiales bacterium]|nr:hypothetical protein [Chlamydiales bacterium]
MSKLSFYLLNSFDPLCDKCFLGSPDESKISSLAKECVRSSLIFIGLKIPSIRKDLKSKITYELKEASSEQRIEMLKIPSIQRIVLQNFNPIDIENLFKTDSDTYEVIDFWINRRDIGFIDYLDQIPIEFHKAIANQLMEKGYSLEVAENLEKFQ